MLTLGLALCLSLVLGGCSADRSSTPPGAVESGAPGTTRAAPATNPSASGPATVGTARSSIVAPGPTTATSPPSSGSLPLPSSTIPVHASPGNETPCVALAAASQRLMVLAAAASSGSRPELDAELVGVKRLFADLANSSPPDVAGDLATVAGALQRVPTADRLTALDGDATVVAARQRVDDWARLNCAFDPATGQPTG